MKIQLIDRKTMSAIMRLYIFIATILSTSVLVCAPVQNTDYVIPPFTFSPDRLYGVMIPVFHFEAANQPDDRENKVVDLKTHRIVTIIHCDTGYDRALNYHETAPPVWSADSSVLLWEVKGKWFDDALVLLKLNKGSQKWQLDLMRVSQKAILTRTREASPKQYEAAKQANAGNGSAYPEGFTVDVKSDKSKITFPYHVQVDLTANPKDIEGFPANLESHLDAIVTKDGNYIVTKFKLGRR